MFDLVLVIAACLFDLLPLELILLFWWSCVFTLIYVLICDLCFYVVAVLFVCGGWSLFVCFVFCFWVVCLCFSWFWGLLAYGHTWRDWAWICLWLYFWVWLVYLFVCVFSFISCLTGFLCFAAFVVCLGLVLVWFACFCSALFCWFLLTLVVFCFPCWVRLFDLMITVCACLFTYGLFNLVLGLCLDCYLLTYLCLMSLLFGLLYFVALFNSLLTSDFLVACWYLLFWGFSGFLLLWLFDIVYCNSDVSNLF